MVPHSAAYTGGCDGAFKAAKHSWPCGVTPAALAVVGISIGGLAGSLVLARVGSTAPRGTASWGRRLQVAAASAEDVAPTLDDVDFVVFSRPPYSEQEQSAIVYYSMASIYLLCAVVLLVGVNLDQAERRRRISRSIVPHEVEPYQICCFRYMAHKESVPCEITEQYYLDARLLHLHSAEKIAERRTRMNVWNYAVRYGSDFVEALTRKHLCLSFLLRAIPTFTRVKRACLIVLEFNLCMLTAAVAINVREHSAPRGRYEALTCSGASGSECFATVPVALISGAILCPVFRFTMVRQMRFTCFVSQSHPSSSRFPLGMRKFATVSPQSFLEAICCMRDGYERNKYRVSQSRTCVHRAVQRLWYSTRPSVNDLRFYGVAASCFVMLLVVALVAGTAAYLFEITVYLKDQVVYHWLAWTLTMFFSIALVAEPLLIFWTDVVWCALVAAVAQHWGFGSNALAATTRYKEVVRQVEELYLFNMKSTASARIQRWWLAVLDMYRAIHEQTAAAIKIQAIRKKMNQKRKYVKDRKWCLKVEVLQCSDLDQDNGLMMISPMVRLMCDRGNPTQLRTQVAWEAGNSASFNEVFFIDIKESSALYVSVWAKGLINEEFVGRGYFEFNDLKSSDKDVPEGHMFNVPLHDIHHGEKLVTARQSRGHVALRVYFLDPLKDPCGVEGQDDWMLPKNRMKFALSKMNPAGRLKVGKMLGNLVPGRTATPTGEAMAEETSHGAIAGHPRSAGGGDAERGAASSGGFPAGRGGFEASLRSDSNIGDIDVDAEYKAAQSVAHLQGRPHLHHTRSGVMRSNGEGFQASSTGRLGSAGQQSGGRAPLGPPPGQPPPTGPPASRPKPGHPTPPGSAGSQPARHLSLTPNQETAGAVQNMAQSGTLSVPGAVPEGGAESSVGAAPPPGAGVGDI